MPILKPTEFRELFFSYCTNDRTYKEAFDLANEYHMEQYGEYRYSDYDSFRNSIKRICG